jgi:hypothetical protein
MNVEGRGIVPPESVWIPLTRSDFIQIKDRAKKQAMERDYRNRRDSWGAGLVGSGRPPNAADLRTAEYSGLLGLIGEWGTVAFINRRMKRDIASMGLGSIPRGDRGIDIVALNLTIQVKTQQNPEYPGMIRRIDEYGRKISMPANAYVFARFDREHQTGVWLLGWAWTKDILLLPVVPARRGSHWNIEVPRALLLPMIRLIKELKYREQS